MKRMLVSLALGGAVAASMIATAAPASAACYDYEGLILHIPTVCVGYDYCDADICIDDPRKIISTD